MVAIVVAFIYCYMVEHNCAPKHTPAIANILARLIYRHIRLAWKLFVGVLYFVFALICIGEMNKKLAAPRAAQGGFATFMDVITTPVQMVVDALVGILGLIAIGVIFGLVCLQQSVAAHPVSYAIAAVIAYLLWLVLNIYQLVQAEVVSTWTYKEDTENYGTDIPTRVLTSTDAFTYSALTFVIWAVAIAIPASWVIGRIA
jgi:hypothetical protein